MLFCARWIRAFQQNGMEIKLDGRGWRQRVHISVQPVFEDVLDIHLKVIRKGTKSLTYRFDFFRGETAIASGELSTVCCICNPGEKIRSIPIPDFIADQIADEADGADRCG